MPTTAMHALRIAIASMASLMFATSCGSETGPEAGALSFSAPAYEFGDVITGSSASREITVTNQQGRATGAIAVSLSGADNGEFGLHGDHCTGSILEHGQSCRLLVRLRPTSPGQKEARLTVRSGGFEATATLRGSGSDGGLALRVGAHDFGATGVATPGTSYEFVIHNSGASRSGAIVTEMAGPDASAFAITRDTCMGAELALGLSCGVSVRFTPVVAGPVTATLTVSASPGGSAVAALTGLGGVAAPLTAEPSSQDFGTVRVSPDLPTAELVFRNTGSSATGRLSARLTGDNPSDFVSDASYCAGATLGPGQQCSTFIRFSPQAPGARSAAYELTDALGTSVSVALSGFAEDVELDIAIPPGGFPETDVGSFSEQIVRVTNRGNVATGAMSLTIGPCDSYACSAIPPFRLDADSCTGTALAPGESCTVTATFQPQSAGFHYGQLEVVEHERHYAALWGVGVTGLLELSRTQLSFAVTALGASSASQEVTVVNTGNHPSEPLSASIEVCGYWDYYCTPSPHFVLDPGTCAAAVLAPGAGCSLTVVFRPQAAGPQGASLKITDGWRSYWVALGGTGASP